MSLFVVLKYLCTHNSSSFPMFSIPPLEFTVPGNFWDSNETQLLFNDTTTTTTDTTTTSLFNDSAWDVSETCNEISYRFEIEQPFPEDQYHDDNNNTSSEPPAALSMCQPFTPEIPPWFAELFGDSVSLPTLLACATVSEDDSTTMTTCDDLCSPCTPGTYGSAEDQCSACAPGSHSPDPGGTACLECSPGGFAQTNGTAECENCAAGTYSADPGATACNPCTDGANFTSAAGSTACIQCTQECPAGKEYWGPCTAASDTFCSRCPPVANCIYTQTGPCGNSSNAPNCECVAGFEMVDGLCVECLPGFFKNQTNPYQCVQWDPLINCPPDSFAINGTRFQDAACIALPCSAGELPDNSTSANGTEGCEWTCEAGFNNTIIWE